MGIRFLVAENGESGAAIFRKQADAISLVILDVTMPVVSGPEAFSLLKSVRPDIPVILSSGYNEAEAIRHFAKDGLAGFLQKPYTALQLAQEAKTVLG